LWTTAHKAALAGHKPLKDNPKTMALSTHYLINGESDLGLSPQDRGLAYGDGVFRTLRVSQAIPVDWALHYEKLTQDCSALSINCPSQELLLTDIERLFTPDEEAVAKIIVTRGAGPRGYAIPAATTPTRIVLRESFPLYPHHYFDEGVTLHLCRLRLSHQPRLAGIKHLNRLENVLARLEWADPKIADGLLLDEQGLVIECTMSNLFARFGETLVTPPLDKCGVAGITRQRILDNASNLGCTAVARELSLDALMEADEIITCNSLYGAWQVRSFNNRQWPKQGLALQIRTLLQE
jgi:4-amino-4-deoxychorismate lyase